ncbi:MAG: polyprenyl synthetase family protein [Candidatus Dadabacteria bacterium]|nr:MAG: polyprenyl synthetase family protein [Candidatus Dadabacteria bacterium]
MEQLPTKDEGVEPLNEQPSIEMLFRDRLQLGGVMDVIEKTLQSQEPLLPEISNYMIGLGGKRIRPAFTLLVSRIFGDGALSEELSLICAGIELIHTATLLHDDIIDRAEQRRHGKSAYKLYGLAPSLLAGNFLFVRAFGLCSRLHPFIVQQTERSCLMLTEGELLDEMNTDFSLETALEIARKKTAPLFALGALAGAFIPTRDKPLALEMWEFGESVGIAFQIVDDILDIIGTEATLGKKIGTDIRERKPSIINVLWKNCGTPLFERLMGNGGRIECEISQQDLQAATKEILSLGIVEEAKEYAEKLIKMAKEKVLSLQRNTNFNKDNCSDLFLLLDYAISRVT